MQRVLAMTGLLLICGRALLAAPAASSPATTGASDPAATVKQVERDYKKESDAFSAAYAKAATKEERQKLFDEKYPKAADYSPKMLEVARANPKSAAAFDALAWVIANDRGYSVEKGKPKAAQTQAIELMSEQFADDPRVQKIVRDLVWSFDPVTEPFLRRVIAVNHDRAAKGAATYILGHYLKERIEIAKTLKKDPSWGKKMSEWMGEETVNRYSKADPDALEKEAISLLETAKRDYGDVKAGLAGTLAASADAELFEMQNLAIGKTAPDIEGQDVDGKPMKLSDFRGKVVVLDFFGDW
ncbi:MAG TPA: hypothetical protein VF669_20240 [Tepidisphaeraceae bacterium]|jgi:hypothetical protein